jgi:hypothetical protein
VIAEFTNHTLWTGSKKYEVEFKLRKRDFGGWTVYVGDEDLGWIVPSYTGGLNSKRDGWTLYFAEAGEIKGRPCGVFETRYEAGSDLIRRLFSGSLDGYPARDPVLDRDRRNRTEVVRNAAVEIEAFAWETGDWDRDERNRR